VIDEHILLEVHEGVWKLGRLRSLCIWTRRRLICLLGGASSSGLGSGGACTNRQFLLVAHGGSCNARID
jgi:hypothetical protein